jgi:hypothetical protein
VYFTFKSFVVDGNINTSSSYENLRLSSPSNEYQALNVDQHDVYNVGNIQ